MINFLPSARGKWYIARLRRMSVAEVCYRLKQTIAKRADKFLLSRFPSKSTGISVYDPGLFFHDFPPGNNKIDVPHPPDMESFRADVDRICNHRFDIFNLKVDFADRLNFHLDPKTGRVWPLKFWGDIDYRDGRSVGGIKFAWELNRFHHWPKLAIADAIFEDHKYRSEIFTELQTWLEANPYPLGINWISGIELGIRIVNLYYSLRIIDNGALSDSQKKIIMQFVSRHADHLYRYPSKYSSCANHALAEALGLFVAGLAFPGLKRAKKWKEAGRNVLEREVTRQIYPDGSSFEHTVPYLQFVADHYLIYYLMCRENNEPIGEDVEIRLKAVCEFISRLIDVKGNIPMVGDDDDGYLLKPWCGEHNNFISLLNTGAVLFNRPEWIHPAAGLDFKTMLLLGSSAAEKWRRLKSQGGWRKQSRYIDKAGLAVMVHDDSGREILFVGNSGPLGLAPLSGHGHADALSFWLSVDGQPFFVDPGTYLYHSGGKWRRYFRSTAAHNTVLVDRQDQAVQAAEFMFDNFYNVSNIYWSERSDRVTWGAEHDGYRRLPDPVIHRREVVFNKKEKIFSMIDYLRCCGRHNICLSFHLHPKVAVNPEGDSTYRLSAGTDSIILKVDEKLKGRLVTGSEDPMAGWYSAGFNRLEKSTTLVFTQEISGESVFNCEMRIL